MRKTRFAGLTQLEADENVFEDNASFLVRNPAIIDHFLEIGAVTHRHDAHPALGNPSAIPSGAVQTYGGTIPADLGIYVGYTLSDPDGGETLVSPILTVNTPQPLDPPQGALTLTPTYNSGALTVDTYYYAITLVDNMGGESLIGPVSSVDREPLGTFASITVDGLLVDVLANGATAWRLYRARGGEQLGYLASGNVNRYVDSGAECVDCGQAPPTVNNTNRSSLLIVQVPAGASGVASGAAGFNLYASLDGSFSGNSLLGTYPPASAGSAITFPALVLNEGEPPDVSTCVRGASLISAEDLAGLYWKRPVATSGLLPADPVGTVRMVSDKGAHGIPFIAGASAALGGFDWHAVDQIDYIVDGQGNRVNVPTGIVVGSGLRLIAAGDVGSAGLATRIGVSGSAGAGHLSSWPFEFQFGGSGGIGVEIRDLGGGSAALNVGQRQPVSTVKGGAVVLDGKRVIEFTGQAAVSDSGGGSALVTVTGDGGLIARTIASASMNLASGASGIMGLNLGLGYRLYGINADRPARLELYASSAYQLADAGRAAGVDPTGNHGVILDFFAPDTNRWALTPLVDGASMEAVPQTAIPITLTNRGTTGVVTVQIIYARTE